MPQRERERDAVRGPKQNRAHHSTNETNTKGGEHSRGKKEPHTHTHTYERKREEITITTYCEKETGIEQGGIGTQEIIHSETGKKS